MFIVSHITVQNGNNAPSLFSRDITKRFGTTAEMETYRSRVGLLARRRYNKDHVTVFFTYKEKLNN